MCRCGMESRVMEFRSKQGGTHVKWHRNVNSNRVYSNFIWKDAIKTKIIKTSWILSSLLSFFLFFFFHPLLSILCPPGDYGNNQGLNGVTFNEGRIRNLFFIWRNLLRRIVLFFLFYSSLAQYQQYIFEFNFWENWRNSYESICNLIFIKWRNLIFCVIISIYLFFFFVYISFVSFFNEF